MNRDAACLAAAVVLVCTSLYAFGQCTGCAAGAAEASYTAALLRCVDKSETLAESKACRSGVDAQFGLKDAGGQ